MGGLTSTTLAATTALLVTVSGAAAADMSFPGAEAPLVPVPVEIGSGWYLRGDVGLDFTTPDVIYGPAPSVNLTQGDTDRSWFVGAGAGFKFNRLLRADVTADWRRQDFRGGLGLDAAHPAVDSAADIWTGLANFYVDLGAWSWLTPYLGAGIGVSYVDLRAPSVSPLAAAGVGSGAAHFAAAAMAGVAFDVSDELKIDFGYRYLWLQDVQGAADALRNRIDYKNLSAHELRVGFRYMLD